MIIDENLAVLRTHDQNIDRYRRLLQTSLTALERDFIERRIVEEQTALDDPASETVPIVMGLLASKAA
jgi:hypothetical protein